MWPLTPTLEPQAIYLLVNRAFASSQLLACQDDCTVKLLDEEMNKRSKTLTFQYGAAVLVSGMALLLTQLLWPWIAPAATTLFYAAVMIAAFYGGLGPGLLATALSALIIDYFFVPPIHALEFTIANLVRVGVFVFVSVITSWLNASRKKLTDDLSERNQERERLLAKISQFNTELRKQVAAATQELSAANQALLQTQQRLIRSERLAVAGQMAASLAHEIGTPLNSISGHLQLLMRDHPQHTDTQRRVQIISKQLDFIVGIVKSLLEWTHKKQPIFQPTDINALVKDILWLVSPMLDQQAIKVTVTLEQELPPVEADLEGLQQVFLNLINNSTDAMPGGGSLQITTRLDLRSQMAELVFRDTGVGLDSEALEHLFEPMWTTKPAGGGFGLAIVREIMTEHGGHIEAITGQDQGAAFRLTLPLAKTCEVATPRKEVMEDVA